MDSDLCGTEDRTYQITKKYLKWSHYITNLATTLASFKCYISNPSVIAEIRHARRKTQLSQRHFIHFLERREDVGRHGYNNNNEL